MSLTPEERKWFDIGQDLSQAERNVMDDIFSEMRWMCENADGVGVKLANDDRAARFEAALVRYLVESKEQA